MTKIVIFTLCLFFTSILNSFSQTKWIVGERHTISLEIPKQWVQTHHDQLPFLIKPDEKNVAEETYSYVYGLDFSINPDINGWINGNTQTVVNNYKDVKVDSLHLQFENLKENEHLTGRYKTITYEYPNKRKEVLLIAESKHTIIVCVFSAENDVVYKKHFSSFIELAKSLTVAGTSLKIK
ncbi:hypothetical protein [Pedobacter gandavensis]|uniref:hypothetical protein n=1 Tax=Pedobacter gandavensis TaxID=2679963 RepID=UPI0029318911|nr:hypothetical protein [Pedobacter gandavensis]